MSSNKVVLKDWTTTFLLAFCLPSLERFYLGCPMSGILKCITCCGCGLWYWIDLFRLAGGSALCANLHGKLQYINGPSAVTAPPSSSNGKSTSKGGGNNNMSNTSDAQNDYFYMIFSCLLGIIVFYYILLPMFQTPIEIVQEEEEVVKSNFI